jgi:hypothetical protein
MDLVPIFESYIENETIVISGSKATVKDLVDYFLSEWLPFEGDDSKSMVENIDLFFKSSEEKVVKIDFFEFVLKKTFYSLGTERISSVPKTLTRVYDKLTVYYIDEPKLCTFPEVLTMKVCKIRSSEYLGYDSYVFEETSDDVTNCYNLSVEQLIQFGYKGKFGFYETNSSDSYEISERDLYEYKSNEIVLTPKEVTEKVHSLTAYYTLNPDEIF